MKRVVGLLLAAAALAPTSAPLAAKGETGLTLVRGRFLDDAIGGVLVRDGRFVEVLAPDDARLDGRDAKVIDGGDAWILPGLVDAGGMTSDARHASLDPITPDHLAIDGFDPFARNRSLLARGITTTWLSPNRARLLTGRGAVVKTAGDARVLRERAELRATLGPEGLNPPPRYDPPMIPHPFDAPLPPALPRPPSSRAKAVEMLRDALAGTKGRVRLHATSGDEIALALELATTLKLDAVFELGDAKAALPFAGRFAGAGSVVLERVAGADAERLLDRTPGLAVTAPPGASRDLLAAAAAVGDDDFSSVTIDAARAIGVADRVGSIARGKDADLVFVDGDPASAEAVVETVIVGGDVVYEREPRDGLLAIRARRILTGDGGVIENGVVVCAHGRIVDVGPDVTLPRDAERIRFDGTVVPGFVDGWSAVGLPGGDTHGGAVGAASPDPERLDALREHGVTSLVLVPRSGSVVGGEASVVKTSLDAGAWRPVAPRAAVLLNFSTGGDRAAYARAVRDTFDATRRYVDAWRGYRKAEEAHRADPKKVKKPNPPRRNPAFDELAAVIEGRLPALVRAERSEEIAAVLAFAKETPDARVHLLGGGRALDHAGALRARGASVLLAGLPGVTLDDGTRASLTIELARRRVAVASTSGGGSMDLLGAMTTLVRGGLSPRDALASVTSVPADALGVGARVGRVARGADADLVLLTRDPGEPGCRIHAVVAGGVVVHREEESE